MKTEIFRRSFSTPRSPPARARELGDQRNPEDRGISAVRTIDMDSDPLEEDQILADIRQERETLEEFLFNDNNKISKNAIKFILTKWSFLESKLYENRLENEKIKSTYRKENPSTTYAMVMSCPVVASTSAIRPVTEKKEMSKR